MNAIRARIIGSWLLLATWVVLFSLHQYVYAIVAFMPMMLVRHSKPRFAQLSPRTERFVCYGIILFCVLGLIAAVYTPPSIVVTIGQAVFLLAMSPLLVYTVYLDCKAFKAAQG